jgi:uncharacterized protein
MRVVLDTSVLVSGLLSSEGPPAQIINLFLNKTITLLYDNRVLLEYKEVLKRKKFGFKQERIEPIIEFIKQEGEFISAEPTNVKITDKDDLKFVEVAITGKANYLITGNEKHFPKLNLIKTPKEFLESIKR